MRADSRTQDPTTDCSLRIFGLFQGWGGRPPQNHCHLKFPIHYRKQEAVNAIEAHQHPKSKFLEWNPSE